MGLLDRLFGTGENTEGRRAAGSGGAPSGAVSEQQALERYRYMLRTAPPETLEQAHAEAFAKLSAEQRQQVLGELANSAPAEERRAVASTPLDDPQALGRVATRAEIRQPGIMERVMGSGAGMGFGTSLLSSFAMGFVGSMVANSFFSAMGGFGDGFGEPDAHGERALADENLDDDASHDSGDSFDDGGMDDFDV